MTPVDEEEPCATAGVVSGDVLGPLPAGLEPLIPQVRTLSTNVEKWSGVNAEKLTTLSARGPRRG